jgi:hypothetical protein
LPKPWRSIMGVEEAQAGTRGARPGSRINRC